MFDQVKQQICVHKLVKFGRGHIYDTPLRGAVGYGRAWAQLGDQVGGHALSEQEPAVLEI